MGSDRVRKRAGGGGARGLKLAKSNGVAEVAGLGSGEWMALSVLVVAASLPPSVRNVEVSTAVTCTVPFGWSRVCAAVLASAIAVADWLLRFAG